MPRPKASEPSKAYTIRLTAAEAAALEKDGRTVYAAVKALAQRLITGTANPAPALPPLHRNPPPPPKPLATPQPAPSVGRLATGPGLSPWTGRPLCETCARRGARANCPACNPQPSTRCTA